jgi:ribonuclease R
VKEIESKLLRLIDQRDYVPLNVPELLRALRLPPSAQQDLQRVLRELERTGRVARIKGNRYIQPREADLIPGRIRMNRQGKGFLQPDDPKAQGNCYSRKRHRHCLERRSRARPPRCPATGLRHDTTAPSTGIVVRVLERRRTTIVGTLQRGRQFCSSFRTTRGCHMSFMSRSRATSGRPAQVGDKVVVELKEWESRHSNPEGEIIEVLGPPGEEGVDMLSVLRQYDLPLHFPKTVLNEARSMARSFGQRTSPGARIAAVMRWSRSTR